MSDPDLSAFSGKARLFPLPTVVMFPHALTPLHIFEPRYKRMIEDAIQADRLIATIRIKPGAAESEAPPLEEVGCLGRIIHHERLADGRFNLLLLGLRRIRPLRETTGEGLPYRVADVAVIEDVEGSAVDLEESRQVLMKILQRAVGGSTGLTAEILELLETAESPGALADVMAHGLPLTDDQKQRLLAEPSVERRFHDLRLWLSGHAGLTRPGRPFPPLFSDN